MNQTARFGFESLTYAMEARDLLARHGIPSNAVRLTKGESPKGCAFGIELAVRDKAAADALLSKAMLHYTVLGIKP